MQQRSRSGSPWIRAFALLILVLIGCHPVYRYPGPTGSLGRNAPIQRGGAGVGTEQDGLQFGSSVGTPGGQRVARAAMRLLGAWGVWVEGQGFRTDCSGLVIAVHQQVAVELRGSSSDLLETAKNLGVFHQQKIPYVGDAAFWANTYDRNGNRKVDDGITHTGIVVGIEKDGTITLVHRGNSAITLIHMNLLHPDVPTGPDGKVWNDRLRTPSRRDPVGTRYLTGELSAGFASFWREIDDAA